MAKREGRGKQKRGKEEKGEKKTEDRTGKRLRLAGVEEEFLVAFGAGEAAEL